MNPDEAVKIIKSKLGGAGSPVKVPLLKKKDRGYFKATLVPEGGEVDNLDNQPLFEWDVFRKTIELLNNQGGAAKRGNAMGPKLGNKKLPLDSIEGHVAHGVYGKQPGDSVFSRITPIACILIWAGICEHAPRELVLSGARPRSGVAPSPQPSP